LQDPDTNGTETKVRLQVMRDLHEVFQRLRNLGARSKEVALLEGSYDLPAFLFQIEPELLDIIREIKRTVNPFVIDNSLLQDHAGRFVDNLTRLGGRYSAPSRKVVVSCDQQAARMISPAQYMHVERIAENCLGNSAACSNATEVYLELVRDSSEPDGWVVLEICDNGIGDPRLNDLDALIDEIYPEHQGLYRVRFHCERLSAILIVQSASEVGTKFTIRIPRGRTE
jgi:hypothetical protein